MDTGATSTSGCRPPHCWAVEMGLRSEEADWTHDPAFTSSMYSRALDDAKPPDAVAIGIGEDGRFRTSSLKEYPPAFCSALAGSLIDEIKRHRASGSYCGSCHRQGEPDLSLVQWVSEAEALCSQLREGATWLPDFQGRQP